MQSRRFWLTGSALVSVVILLVTWFGFVNPQLSSTAALKDQSASAQQQNDTLQFKNNKLKKENEDVATLRAGLAAALAQLPSDGGLPAFTRQLSAQATANSVTLTSVIVGTVTSISAAAGQAAPATEVATTTQAPATTATTTTGITDLASSGSLVQIPVTVVVTGLGKDAIAFLKAIQVTGPRRALVTGSQLSPEGGNPAKGIAGPCTLTLTLTVFSTPLAPAAQAALQKLLGGK